METESIGLESPSGKAIRVVTLLIKQRDYNQALIEISEEERKRESDLTLTERGHLCYLASLCLFNLGQYKEAEDKALNAYEILRNIGGNEEVAQIQDILSQISLSLGDLRNAELYLRDAISTYRRIGNQTVMVHAYNLIARINFVRCDFEKSLEYLNDALQLSQELGDTKAKARVSGNIGMVYVLMGEWKKATENLEISLNYHKASGDILNLCRVLLSMGFLNYLQRNFQTSRNFLAKALEIAEVNGYLRELAIYYEYSGQLALAENDENKAVTYFLRSKEVGQEVAPDSDISSQSYRLLAELQVTCKHWDEALVSCQESLKISQRIGEKIEEAACYRILGQIYSFKGEKEEASDYFKKSISFFHQIGTKYELAITYLEAGRSQVFDYYKTLGLLGNAESLFRDLESKYHLGLVNLAVAELMVEEKEYDKAQVFLVEAERQFKESHDPKELRQVHDLKRSIEETLFHSRVIARTNGRMTFDNVETQNIEMREIISKLKLVKDYDVNILLEGETGSGKDLFAKAIHYSGKRKDQRFVPVNCAALPENLLENELFGHRKGSYTGADKDQPGLFEEAEGGTLYLDQVEEMPLSTQVKLLRAIEEKEITRIGETKPRKTDVRIISSSIEDLKEAVRKGKFRQDLYYRLNTFKIRIPPLKERREDIPLLVNHFLKEFGLEEKRIREFERNGTIKRFMEYDWPGNVRELQSEIKRMVILSQATNKDPSALLSEKLVDSDIKDSLSHETTLFDIVEKFEQEKIIEALKQCHWVKLRAARLLGIPEGTLRSKMKKYKISRPPADHHIFN
jgi:DNA-binding NtrC family response regulator/tetratricopeptide (TPR) repeat protein